MIVILSYCSPAQFYHSVLDDFFVVVVLILCFFRIMSVSATASKWLSKSKRKNEKEIEELRGMERERIREDER